MKRIAFLTNSVFTCGGEQRVTCIIANELSLNNDVTVFTEDPSFESNPYNLSERIKVIPFSPFKAPTVIKGIRFLLKLPLFKLLRNFSLSWKMTHFNSYFANNLKKILTDKYDTVIAVSDRLSLLLACSKKMGLDVKTIMWEHNSFECYFRTKNHRCWKQDNLFKELSSFFDECIVLNEDYSEKYKKYLGIDCKVIYNPRSFVSESKALLDNKSIICCCVLDIEPKGLDMLIDSYKRFCQKNTDWNLLIAGDGVDKIKLERMVHAYGLSSRVSFLGYRKDVKELLLQSSIFVLPSRWEGFPMSLTEAYECGLPCVFYDIPAVIPFNKNKEGVCCKSFNTDEFADKLLELAQDKELRVEYGNKAKNFAKSISIENIVKEWKSII